MSIPHPRWLLACLAVAVAGCSLSLARTKGETSGLSNRAPSSRLVIFHLSDNEAELLGPDPQTAGLARFVSILERLRAKEEGPHITVGAGDTFMPAPALDLVVEGQNPVATANAFLGLQASALGNHEFDLGEGFLAEMIARAPFPYLTATVDFQGTALESLVVPVETTPWLDDHPGSILKRGKLCAGIREGDRCDGVVVGIVGATTETLRTVSSHPLEIGLPESFDEVRERIQAQVDALLAEGLSHVVLLSHLQDVSREIALVESGLEGVDVIVSGGGDDRLANQRDRLLAGDDRHPLCAAEPGCYPILRKAKDGAPVAIVATDGQYRYVGRLAVHFDDRGVLTSIDPASGPVAVDDETALAIGASPNEEAGRLEGQVRLALEPAQRIFLRSEVFLEGERETVRNRETNLADLSADAMIWAARAEGMDAAFALRNGGGIRASIGRLDPVTGAREGGALTAFDLQAAFRFDNPLVRVTASRRALVETLESALRGAGTGRGHFPQVSGEVFLVYDPAAAELALTRREGDVDGIASPGSRVKTLRIAGITIVEEGRILDPDEPISFITLDYLARGGDGWFPGSASSLVLEPVADGGREIREQESLRRFLLHLEEGDLWARGHAYPDPIPGKPETFKRIRALPGW